MKRLLALVVAVALVAGAVWLRGRLTADDDGSSAASAAPAEEYRLLCVTELRDVCGALDGEDGIDVLPAESAGGTLERLSADDEVDFDGWLTPRSWVEVAAATLPQAFGPAATTLASSPLVLAARPEQLAEIIAACPGLAWDCIGRLSKKLGADRPTDGAWGPAVLGQQAASFFTRADISGNEVRDSSAFRTWLAGIIASSGDRGTPSTPAATLLNIKQGAFDAVGTIRAEVLPPSTSAPVDPTAAVELVLAEPSGAAPPGEQRVAAIRSALVGAGWSSDAAAAGALPSGGTLVALRDLWEELAR